MSTSSGNAAKGEKGKSSKYHVLDINTLYKSKGNEQEVQLQKSTAPRKHGLQKLGTLPSARRPTNLPSLKSESSNTDSTAVNLVSGSNTRWGNKQGESNQTAPTTESNSTQDISSTTTTGMSQPVQHAQPPHPIQGIAPVHTMGHMLHHGPPDVKTWAMMTHGDATGIIAPSFLTSQSPLFQQEFPSLSNSDTPGGANASSIKGAGVGDMQYGPGPSLRPQTEGSWIQGGNRSQGMTGQGPGNQSIAAPAQGHQMTSYPPIGSDGDRNNLGQSGVGVVPGGPYAPSLIPPHLLPPQFRGVMPSFMLRNAYPSGFPPNFQPPPLNRISPRPAVSTSQPPESFSSSAERNSPPTPVMEELKPVNKPVAKEEEVKKVIETIEETSWAYSEDDYVIPKTNENENDSDKYEKFSDSDEQKLNSSKEPPKIQIMTRDKANYDSKTSTESWQNPRASQLLQSSSDYRSNIPPRFQNVAVHRNADEEDSSQDRRRANESAIQRARLRKEEEEKRYVESKEAAAKKLKMLEQKIGITSSQEKENKMPNSLFSNREVNIPLPDWEKEKSKSAAVKSLDENVTAENNRKSQPSSAIGRIPVVRDGSEFKELTQIGDRNALSRIKEKERDVNYGSSGGPYSRHMGDIPPRFQKQQQQSGALSMQRQNSASGNNTNISQASDMRKNAAFQSQYSSKSSLVSRRDRKDSDISSTENDRWEDERRKDHYSPDVEYNMDKDRFSRNNYRNKEVLDDYDRSNSRDGEFRDRESSVNYKNYSSGGPYQEYGRDRDYNKRPSSSAYYTDNSLRDENWPDHDRDRDRHKSPNRSYEKDSESDNKRSSYAEPVSSVESEHIRECNEQERDRNKGWDRDREYDREPDYNRRNTYSSSNSTAESSFRDRQHEQRKTYLNEENDDVASHEYEANNDNEQQTFWEKSANENERDKRRDYNNKNRTVSESVDSRDNNRRRSHDFYDAKLYQPAQSTEKGRDWADSHERKDTYNSSNSRGVDKSPRDNYEGKNEDYKKSYEYDKRDRDYEHGNDIRHDRRSPLSAPKTDTHERVRKDSKTSYESFHDDLTNYDDLKTSHSSWAEETELAMKYSRRETLIYKEERNDHRRDHHYIHPPRHIPGPITRDRLEASKLDQESKANLTQLVRSSDKRNKKSENAGAETTDTKRSNTSLSKEDSATTPDKIENKPDQKVPIKDKQNEIQKESTNVTKQPPLQPQPLMEIKIDPEKDIKDKNISVDDNMKTGNYQKNIGNTSKYPSDSKRSDRRAKSDRGGKRAAAHRPHTHTVYTSKREPIYRGSNQRNSSSRYTNRWHSTREKKSDWAGSDSADDISVESVKTDDKSHSGYNRNGKSGSRKSERNDGGRNHDYRPQDSSEFYSNSNNRKYDSVRSGRDNIHYNEPSRRGRGGFKGKSGYGPPPTKSPFTKITQPENDKENSRKDSIQSQKGDDQKLSSTGVSADKLKSNNSGNKSHDPNMLSQMKTDIDSKDRGWKGKRNVHSYSSNVYKKSDYLAISHGGGHHGETEEAWETASEGTSTEEVRSRQSKEHLAGTAAGSGKRPGSKSKKSNYRSSSRRRNYDSRRAMQNNAGKRETQQFYDCRSQVLSKHGTVGKRVNSVGDEKGFDKPALNGEVTENIITSQEKSADPCNTDAKNLDDRPMEPRNISDSFHSSSHGKKAAVKDARRQKSGLPSSGRSTSSKAANSSAAKNSYNPSSVAPRFQKNKNSVPDGKSFSDKDRSSVTSSSSTTFSVNEPGPPRPAPPPTVNAWDKPITASFRSMSPAPSSNSSASKSSSNDNNNRLNDSRNYVAAGSANSENMSTSNVSETVREQRTAVNKSSSSLSKQTSREKSQSPSEKEQQSSKVLSEKRTIETGGPLQTMIIENTNYKSNASSALDMTSSSKVKYDEQLMKTYEKNAANLAFSTGGSSEHSSSQPKHDTMGMASLALSKQAEDGSDMKLDFTFDSADLTEDNKSGKSLEVTHSIQIAHTATAADLNFKIASVKKVWEDGAAIVKFEDDNSGVITSSSFTSSFNAAELNDGNVCYVKNGTNSPSGVQVDDVSSLSHSEVYSPVTQIAVVNSSYGSSSNCPPNVMKADPNSSSSNVCKVKPQPQSVGTNASGVTTLTTISASLNTHSPPVSSPSSYTFSSPTPQPNLTGGAAAVALAAAAAAHINFQAAAQYNTMPPIPSPPTMLFSSSPQLPAGAPSGLFQTYQIESTPMISNQPPRSQFGQYPPAYGLSNGLGQTAGFNQQSVYVHQSGPPPPPPPQPSAAPQDIYSSQLPQYRMQAPPPPNFPNSQQLNATPNTVLISSSSNSLMSAGVKPPPQPTTQQIGAMSTKAGYSATPQPSQVYIPYEATQMVSQNYLSGNQMVQPRPGSNVPPPPPPPNAMPPVSSYYNAASSGGGQGAFYQTGGNSNIQPPAGAPPYSITAFNAQTPAPPTLPNFSQLMNQQFRIPFLKGNTTGDLGNTKAVLTSPHELLNTVFPSGPQPISSSSKPPRMQNPNKPVMQPQGLSQQQHSMQQHGSYPYHPQNQGFHPHHHHHQRSSNLNAGGNVRGGNQQYPLAPIQRPANSNVISRAMNNPNTINSNNNSGNSNNNQNQNNMSSNHRNAAAGANGATTASPSSMRGNSHQMMNNIQHTSCTAPSSATYYTSSSA